MTSLRLLVNLLLLLALVAGGPLPARAAASAMPAAVETPAATAPCHAPEASMPADHGNGHHADEGCTEADLVDCCGCDCLHAAATPPSLAVRLPASPPGEGIVAPASPAWPPGPTRPELRPPIA